MGDITKILPSVASIPRLEFCPGGQRLLVQDKPYLMLGAELQNSSFSCPQYMKSVWGLLKNFNVNTVLANVTWEAIEPEEGIFDFSRLNELVIHARRHALHLVLLWFGAFKNAKSTYAPSWVKTDAKRFPRAQLRGSKGRTRIADAISIFHPEIVKADAAAFTMLMNHVREIDEEYSTILMIQVENEPGLLGDSRDACPEAEKQFKDLVPSALVDMLHESWDRLHPSLRKNLRTFAQQKQERKHEPEQEQEQKQEHVQANAMKNQSWEDCFGVSLQTDELFMAYHFARYVEEVARAGKAIYALPVFVNVWQNYADEDNDKSQPTLAGGGGEPGDYPSGGGVINVVDIWQEFAPSLDFIAPDIYLNDYDAVCKKYQHRGQALFIPEQRRDEYGARRIWSAYGAHRALCAAPFGIDTLDPNDTVWTTHFGLLAQVSEYVLAAREKVNSTFGFFFDELKPGQTSEDAIQVQFGDWKLTIRRSFVFGKPGPGFGMIFHLDSARFLLVGEGFQVSFDSAIEGCLFTGILSFTEKISDPHTRLLSNGRMLNGDETRSGEFVIMPSGSPDYGDFPISITIPARTRIAECEVYALF